MVIEGAKYQFYGHIYGMILDISWQNMKIEPFKLPRFYIEIVDPGYFSMCV